MKAIKSKLIIPFLLFIMFALNTSCESLNTALQYANQGMGGVCNQMECKTGYYNSDIGEYRMDQILTRTLDGVDIENNESYWVNARMNESLNYGIGVYYFDSPYSEVSYKFVVDCVEWQ
jgi:hypothetical protein